MKKNSKLGAGGYRYALKKTLQIMRWSLFIFIISIFQVQAITGFSQKSEFTLNFENTSVATILSKIEDQSNFYFMCNRKLVNLDRIVSIHTQNQPIENILKEIFKGTDVEFIIKEKQIILKAGNSDSLGGQGFQQQKSVSGKVTDFSGQPLPGVSIIIKGTTNGVITDANGNYSLSKVPDNTTLVFSFVGMKSQELKVDGKSSILVKMEEDNVGVDEVVVVGFATQKKVNLTGSVSSINSKTLESRPVNNVGQMLQGVVPGLNLQTSGYGGELNQTLSINIRGTGTIGSGSTGSPLILIDGMEGDMNILNPQDIDNISVLKDAAAASIYGSRAPFGVVLITTKQGKKGKTAINYNNNFKFNKPLNMPKYVDSYTFALYFNDAALNGGESAQFSSTIVDRILQYQRGEITTGTSEIDNGQWRLYQYSNANTNWLKELYKNSAFSQEHNISVNGGTDAVQYYISGNFSDQNGLLRYGNDKFDRYSLTAKINTVLNKFVKFNVNTKFIREDYNKPTHLNGTFYYNTARAMWPTVPIKDPNGHYTVTSNIPQLTDGGRTSNVDDWLYSQGQLVITPLKGWNIFAEGNFRIRNTLDHAEVLPCYYYDVNNNPVGLPVNGNVAGYSFVSEHYAKQNFFTPNIYSDYNFTVANDHNFKIMAGFNSELYKSKAFGASRTDLITSDLPELNVGTANSKATDGSSGHWATAGFFGRLNYNYKERYLLEINGRYDGSSRFLRDQRWNFFPSLSAGWNISHEEFWNKEGMVSMLKLRGSYGGLGNQNTSSFAPFYQTQPVTTEGGSWLLNGKKPNISSAPGLVSSTLTWERIKTWNIGFDMGMFNNKLIINGDYFVRKTMDMVGPAPELPVILGTSVPQTNNTEMKSTGFELEIKWQDRIGKLNYSVRGVLSDDRQEILKYPNKTGNIWTYYNGKYLGDIYGYTTIGIAKTQTEMNDHLAVSSQQQIASKWGAGDIMYKDLNNDKQITQGSGTLNDKGDLKIIGNNMPRFRFSLDLNGDWKGFDFRIFFQGVGKRDFMPSPTTPYFWSTTSGLWQTNTFKEHMDYFRDETSEMVKAGVAGVNLDSYFPKPYFNTTKNCQPQTRYLQNAAYIRLKNLSIGYSLPKTMLERTCISKLRVFISGENLWTGTKLISIFDPEVLGIGNGDGRLYPLSKVYSMGLSINL